MIATPRIQRRSDYRPQAIVKNAGSIEIALEYGTARSSPPISYSDHHDLLYWLDRDGGRHVVRNRGFVSGSMTAVWDNMCCVDALQSLAEVDPDRIGCIGHSLGGHSAIFTSVFEPRPFLASAATRDNDFDVSGVRDVMEAAKPIFEMHQAGSALEAIYPEAPHSFPEAARLYAYLFLEKHLRKKM